MDLIALVELTLNLQSITEPALEGDILILLLMMG